MSSSPLKPNSRDLADRGSSAAGVAVLAALLAFVARSDSFGPRPGEIHVERETTIRLALAPPPAPQPEPAPQVQEEQPIPELTPPQPEEEPPVEEPPAAEVPPVEEPPPVMEGEAGTHDAARVEWIVELRRRIEENKFYPGAARYTREAGTVTLNVRISRDARIEGVEVVRNTGSALLAEGARTILRRAGATPLGTNRLPEAIEVEVPITYRVSD